MCGYLSGVCWEGQSGQWYEDNSYASGLNRSLGMTLFC